MSRPTQEGTEKLRLLAAGMRIVYNFGDPNERYRGFLSYGRAALKSFINGLLLYDEIVIPTHDFLSLAALIEVLGERSVLELLESSLLRFLRVRGLLVYSGGGGGIQPIGLRSPEGVPAPLVSSPEAAVEWALDGLPGQRDPLLARLVLQATQDVGIESLVKQVRHETYMDVLNSTYLRSVFALRNKQMNRLAGIEENQHRCYGGPYTQVKGDEIGTVLALAAANLELRLTQLTNCMDSSTASLVGHVIKAKVKRCFGEHEAVDSFLTLCEIADIPDVGESVLQKRISTRDLIRLAQSRNGREFRTWFHESCREDPVAIAKEYTALLRDVPFIQSLPAKIIRFIATSVLGEIPIVGSVAGAVDSFFVEEWLKGTSPKFFIEDLSQHLREPG